MTARRHLAILAIALATTAPLYAGGGIPHTFRLQDQPVNSSTPPSNSVTDIIVDGSTVWIGSGKGLSNSSDAGRSWNNYYNTAPFGTEDVSALAIGQVRNNKIIWVATAHSEQVTTDLQSSSVGVGSGLKYKYFYGADTIWHQVPQPLDSNNRDKTILYGGHRYSALPVIVPQQNLTYDISITPSGTVFIASFAGGLRKSTDNGANWDRVFLPGDGVDSINPRDTVPYNIELNPVKNFNHRVFSVIAIDDSVIYCGTASGINKSTDGGISWQHYSHHRVPGISGNFVVALAEQKVGTASTIWAATVDADRTADPTEQRAVSYSKDNGRTWTTANPLRGAFTHNFGFLGSVAYAATDTGLWRTDDAGATWSVRNSFRDSIRRQPVTQIEVFSAGGRLLDSLLFIGTADGIVVAHETGAFIGNFNVLHASKTLKSGKNTYSYPNPFSPSQEITRIHYRLDDPGVTRSGSVTIDVYDFAMNPVRNVCRNAMRDNLREYDEIWDGLTDGGKRAANGVYHYSVRVDDGDRRWGKIIVLQ